MNQHVFLKQPVEEPVDTAIVNMDGGGFHAVMEKKQENADVVCCYLSRFLGAL